MKNEALFLKACRREITNRTPIWLMRQAGRYMPEYQSIRNKVGFLELCKNHELAAEVTVFAAKKLKVDAAIIFSDILLIVEPLGFQLSFAKDHGPVIGNPFRRKNDFSPISNELIQSRMSFVFDAIRLTKENLPSDIPLIGFAGAPFTVASYLVEGGKSRDFLQIKEMIVSAPEVFAHLMVGLTEATIEYIKGQIKAGADAIQLFDSWIGSLSIEQFRQWVLPSIKKLVSEIKGKVPVIYYGLNTGHLLPAIREIAAEVVGIDATIQLKEAWRVLGDIAMQGNLNPEVLLTDKKSIKMAVEKILKEGGGKGGHIFNLGHGVLPQTPVDNAVYLVEIVKELSLKK